MNSSRNYVSTVIKTTFRPLLLCGCTETYKLSNKYMFVFFDTKYTQNLEKHEVSFEHVPNLICAQQMFSKCETIEDMNIDFEQCGKRVRVYWEDRIGKFIDYIQLSIPFAEKVYVLSHSSREYYAQFLLRRFMDLSWLPE
jgi:hypothetical protein